ncbi:MAG: alpha/beta fold hydrolase [Acidimicrobiia bacterium]
MDLPAGSLELGTAHRGHLLFLPGFLVGPRAYTSLLTPIAEAGFHVVVPRLSRRSPSVLRGRRAPDDEATDAIAVARRTTDAGGALWLGGHSRGGLVAWLAAPSIAPVGLVLVDPVSGGGGPRAAPEPPPRLTVHCPRLVIGCALGGRCAPAGRNHAEFARVSPGCAHVVVPDCGHADMLNGADARLGRLACGHGRDPAAARAAITELLRDFVTSP